MNGNLGNMDVVTFIDATIPSHKILWRRVESRHNGGVPVEVGSFLQEG